MKEMQRYQRACLLAEQGRYPLAAEEALLLLSENPNSDRAHNILSFIYARQKKFDAAIEAAHQAIAQSPQYAFHHYRLADVYHQNGQHERAAEAIASALQLDPDDPDNFGLGSLIFHDWDRLETAQQYAEQGLRLDPENDLCLRMRVLCLMANDRWDEAADDVMRSLRLFPESCFAHAAWGWLQLHQGKHSESLESFKTALQLNPNHDWARRGLMEALKAQNWLYRGMMGYELWQRTLQNRKPGLFWTMWLAIPHLRALYWLFFGLSLTVRYVFDVVLRFHPYGCLLFTDKEKWFNNCGAIMLVSVGLSWVGVLLTKQSEFILAGVLLGAVAYGVCATWFGETVEQRWLYGILTGIGAIAVLLLGVMMLPGMSKSAIQDLEAIVGLLFFVFLFGGLGLWILIAFYQKMRSFKQRNPSNLRQRSWKK